MAALTWPLPPSTMTRSGIAQRRASSTPSSPARTERKRRRRTSWWLAKSLAPLDRLDPEPAVLAGARLAILEDDHAADRFAALEVADVVALDAQRRPGSPSAAGELLERGERLALVGQPAGLLARERLAGVPRRQGEQLALLAALRDAQVDGPAAGSEGRPRGRRKSATGRRQVDLARDRAGARVVLLEEAGQDLVVRRPRERHRAGRRPARSSCRRGSTNSWIAAWLSWRARPSRSSSVRAKAAIFWLSIVRSIARILSRSAAARSYSVRSAAAGHLALERLDERSPGDPRGRARPARCPSVVVLRDGRDARSLAALDVVEEARPLERAHAVLDVDRAGPEREEAADEVHRLVDAGRRRIRPEVAAAVVDQLARPLDSREIVAEGDLDVRVALVVLEPDVEARPVALDQVRLEQERLGDRVGLGHLDVDDAIDDAADPVDLAARAPASASTSGRGSARLCALPT